MKKTWLFIIIILGIIGFIYFSPMFGRTPPQIIISANKYINPSKPVTITMSDKLGLKKYKIALISDGHIQKLISSRQKSFNKTQVIKIQIPANLNNQIITIDVLATDNSKWHFFSGNSSHKSITLRTISTPPFILVIDNSYAIGNGGSAIAIVKIQDKFLKSAYILVNNKYKFHLTPFYKKGYYISLLAWPLGNKSFNANVIATDLAGNSSQTQIPLYWKNYKYKTTKIKVPKAYILSKVVRLLSRAKMSIPNTVGKIFAKANSVMRIKDNHELSLLTTKTDSQQINSFSLHNFRPLPGSALEAYFSEHRMYYYNHKLISQSYHQGIDVAKNAHSKVYASNLGKVTAETWISLYGNALIIYHGLGLYTLFAHTSSYLVPLNATVHKGEAVARTGATGDAFGPHLHFGVYIQGNAVNPFEWLDSHWIKINITNIITKAKKIINN